jgi:hypothetical protein
LTLAIVVGLLYAGGAQATHLAFVELEGNAVDAAGGSPNLDDWQNLYNGGGTASSHFTKCSAAVTTNCFDTFSLAADKIGKEGDTSYFTGGGSKDREDITQWQWGPNDQSPDKNDITNAFAAAYRDADSLVLAFGADRHAVNGDAQIGFWFNQAPMCLSGGTPAGEGANCPAATPNQASTTGKFVDPDTGTLASHQEGDILALVNFDNGGTIGLAGVYRWNDTTNAVEPVLTGGGIDCKTISDPTDFCTTSNTDDLAGEPPWPYNAKGGGADDDYEQSAFFEGIIDLDVVSSAGTCFPSFLAETRSSSGPSTGLSLDAQLKDFALGKFQLCGSSLTTTPKTGAGGTIPSPYPIETDGTNSVADEATVTVTGINTWSGTLKFWLCGPPSVDAAGSTCDGTSGKVGTEVTASPNSPVPINQSTPNGKVLSPTAIVTSAGRYCWRAFFDSSTPGVSDQTHSDVGECFTVSPVTPTLTTTAVDANGNAITAAVPFGSAIYDKASLTGTANKPGTPVINPTTAGTAATGTITFRLYGPDADGVIANQAACDALPLAKDANGVDFPSAGISVNVSGDSASYGGPPTVGFTPGSPGYYFWKAVYSGDSPNTNGTSHNGDCQASAERVQVQQLQTAMTTRQYVYPQDKVRITVPSGGGNLDGHVRFTLHDSLAECQSRSDIKYDSGSLAVTGASPQTKVTNNQDYEIVDNTTHYWNVSYVSTNNPAHLGSSSVCTESTVVTYAGNDTTNITTIP